MSQSSVLITGGAGFIGSYVADELLDAGYSVRALDALVPQVHGTEPGPPDYLDDRVELQVGDIQDTETVREALDGMDAVVHLAAAVGVGQSMYQIEHYTAVNNLGTSVLLEAIAEDPIDRLVVASSMSLYGEGRYESQSGRTYDDVRRTPSEMRSRQWEPHSQDGEPLRPIPTPEDKRPHLASVYALSKFDQEQMCLIFGRAYDVPTIALRLFNVYGPRQSLNNPYTGVIAIFASRLLNDQRPLIYEDGEQRRDFVHARDIAQAFRLSLESRDVEGETLNVGSGESRTVEEVAQELAAALGKSDVVPDITQRGRVGDVRHCFADIGHARELLGYEPSVSFDEGLRELVAWLGDRDAEDRIGEADSELKARGLTY